MKPILGQEAITHSYGLGRVTEIGPTVSYGGDERPAFIGVTPYVARYQMKFAPHNVELVPISGRSS